MKITEHFERPKTVILKFNVLNSGISLTLSFCNVLQRLPVVEYIDYHWMHLLIWHTHLFHCLSDLSIDEWLTGKNGNAGMHMQCPCFGPSANDINVYWIKKCFQWSQMYSQDTFILPSEWPTCGNSMHMLAGPFFVVVYSPTLWSLRLWNTSRCGLSKCI